MLRYFPHNTKLSQETWLGTIIRPFWQHTRRYLVANTLYRVLTAFIPAFFLWFFFAPTAWVHYQQKRAKSLLGQLGWAILYLPLLPLLFIGLLAKTVDVVIESGLAFIELPFLSLINRETQSYLQEKVQAEALPEEENQEQESVDNAREPEVLESEAREPEAREPEAREPEVLEPEVLEPEALESDARKRSPRISNS